MAILRSGTKTELKHQNPNTKRQKSLKFKNIKAACWSLFGVWFLVFGV